MHTLGIPACDLTHPVMKHAKPSCIYAIYESAMIFLMCKISMLV